MKKFINTKTTLILVGLLAVLFNLIFWVIVGVNMGDGVKMRATLWISYAMIMVAFIAAAGVTFIRPKNQSADLALVPFIVATAGFLGLSLLLNVIFIAVNSSNKGAYITDIVLNCVLIIVFAAILVVAYKHFSRVEQIFEKKQERVENYIDWNGKVSSLISLAEDDEVKAALIDLRRTLNYSSSASNEKTEKEDNNLVQELDNIGFAIKSGASKEEQLKAVKFAKVALEERNRAVAKAR